MTNFENLTSEKIAEYCFNNISNTTYFNFFHCPLNCPAWSVCKEIRIDNNDHTKTCKECFLLWLNSETKEEE